MRSTASGELPGAPGVTDPADLEFDLPDEASGLVGNWLNASGVKRDSVNRRRRPGSDAYERRGFLPARDYRATSTGSDAIIGISVLRQPMENTDSTAPFDPDRDLESARAAVSELRRRIAVEPDAVKRSDLRDDLAALLAEYSNVGGE